MKEKTYVDDIDRSIYDIKDKENDAYKVKAGLTPEIVEKISKEKNDPAWMQQFRLQSLQIYNSLRVPNWGPDIEDLDMDNIVTYVRPKSKMSAKWSEVPKDIKDTFERLGIPQAEQKSLAGVGAQYDSELVYHNVRAEVAAQGVVYTDLESAMHGEYADMIRTHCTGQSGPVALLCTCQRACRLRSRFSHIFVSMHREPDSLNIL